MCRVCSQDNLACYLFTYQEEDDEDTTEADELQACLPSKVDFEAASRVARLLRYNLVANDGRDFGDKESLEACATLCEAAGETDRAEAARKDAAKAA